MYALSVRQPFASQIAIGQKTIEWRSRPFKHKGSLLICATKKPRILLDNGLYLPTASAICIVDMVGCREFTERDLKAACCEDYDYSYGPPIGFAWLLENPREIEPIPMIGKLAPWPWTGQEPVLCLDWHEQNGFIEEG